MIGWDSRDTLSISAHCSSEELEGWKEDSGHLIPFQEDPAPLSQAGVHWGAILGDRVITPQGSHEQGSRAHVSGWGQPG